MEIISQFLYRGTYTDYENTFQRKAETPVGGTPVFDQGRCGFAQQRVVPPERFLRRGPSQQVAHVPVVQLRPLQEPDCV